MEVAHGIRFDTFAGTAPLKRIQIIISRAASIDNKRGRHTRVLALYDINVAFWQAQLPHDEPLAMYPPHGEEEAGYMWHMKRAVYGTRRASRLFQEHMKGGGSSEKQAMQRSRYVTKYITALRWTRWLQSTTSSQKASPRSFIVSMRY